jgi:hypothetical protein
MFDIRPAKPSERGEIAHFLHQSFKAKIPLERWRALIDGRWGRPDDSFGISLLDDGELVGFLGMVPAARPVADGVARTSNMTSWYLQAPYRGRGLGMEMLCRAMAAPGITYTNFSSVPKAIRLLEKAGLGPMDERRLIWRAGGGAKAARLFPAAEAPAGLLNVGELKILEDHRGQKLEALVAETAEGEHCLLVLSVKRKHDDYMTHEVLHLGNPRAFARNARAVAAAVLPPTGAVLSVDWRFLGEDAGSDAVEKITVPRFFTPGQLAPSEVDFLYSETVLLDLKLY